MRREAILVLALSAIIGLSAAHPLVNETASYSSQKTMVDVQGNPNFNNVQPGVYWDGPKHVDGSSGHIAGLVQNKVTYAGCIMSMYDNTAGTTEQYLT